MKGKNENILVDQTKNLFEIFSFVEKLYTALNKYYWVKFDLSTLI